MQPTTFDFIVVGGGTAGCVLAARLSERADLQILLIEAGTDRNDDPKVLTPLVSRRMFKDPDYDWCYDSIPQKGANGRIFENTRGKMLGGSSGINSHSLVYPNRAMHDEWASIAGNHIWSWEHMEKYYRKFQTQQAKVPGHGRFDGPIQASFPAQMHPLQKAWENVFDSLSAKATESGESGGAMGGFTTTNAIDSRPGKGERSFAANTYLPSAMHRSNLRIDTGALVQRVLFKDSEAESGPKLEATGVQYELSGETMIAHARREVILCAGAFGSPQILELSGIGDKNILEGAGVRCQFDSPRVGENLQDHLNFGPSVEVLPQIETMDNARRDADVAAAQREEYDQHRTGPLSEGGAYSFAHWPLQMFNSSAEEQALEGLIDGSISTDDEFTREQYKFVNRMIRDPTEASATVFMLRMQRYTTTETLAEGNYMTVVAMLAHPFSRGSVHITSPNPQDHPRIDNGYLTHPLDEDILAKHIIQIERLLEGNTYSSILQPNGNRLPREFNHIFTNEDDAKKAIRMHGATNYHPCGTCAMAREGLGGVVDGDLRVYGTAKLRICDASIFPIIPRGNILTTVYAVAELGSDIILQSLLNES